MSALTAAERIAARWGIAAGRNALAAIRRDEFPGVTERRRTDQALAATRPEDPMIAAYATAADLPGLLLLAAAGAGLVAAARSGRREHRTGER